MTGRVALTTHPDALPSAPPLSPRRVTLIVLVLSLAVFMSSLDLFIVNLAFPYIGKEYPSTSLSASSGCSTRTPSCSPLCLCRLVDGPTGSVDVGSSPSGWLPSSSARCSADSLPESAPSSRHEWCKPSGPA